jgi:hypothetical protein
MVYYFFSRQVYLHLVHIDNHYFYNEFVRDVESVALKTGNYVNRSLQEYLASEQENKTEKFVKKFNTAKADFIRSYLFDCLCQEDIYENYETYFFSYTLFGSGACHWRSIYGSRAVEHWY